MSATRDKSQKIKFLHSNLYQIHGDSEPKKVPPSGHPASPTGSPSKTSGVIKAGDLNQDPLAALLVKKYQTAQLQGKRVERPASLSPSLPPSRVSPTPNQAQSVALKELKENLKTLNDLHARLRFMLKELEDLVHD